ncbi:MAG TPA: SRPBCC family protein [Solirubrobacterales bacterium]|nr:SRPBCC family protein [Solirubrobacterales bacterium]
MSELELTVQRTFDSPREDVFEAWTSPEVMRRWFAAEPDWTTPTAEVDLRAGGRVCVSMAETGGEPVHTFEGIYLEVEPPERIVFTVEWQGDDADGVVSTVTVEFREHDGRTTVVLTQTGLASEESRDDHEDGWTKCLANLDVRVLSARAQ